MCSRPFSDKCFDSSPSFDSGFSCKSSLLSIAFTEASSFWSFNKNAGLSMSLISLTWDGAEAELAGWIVTSSLFLSELLSSLISFSVLTSYPGPVIFSFVKIPVLLLSWNSIIFCSISLLVSNFSFSSFPSVFVWWSHMVKSCLSSTSMTWGSFTASTDFDSFWPFSMSGLELFISIMFSFTSAGTLLSFFLSEICKSPFMSAACIFWDFNTVFISGSFSSVCSELSVSATSELTRGCSDVGSGDSMVSWGISSSTVTFSSTTFSKASTSSGTVSGHCDSGILDSSVLSRSVSINGGFSDFDVEASEIFTFGSSSAVALEDTVSDSIKLSKSVSINGNFSVLFPSISLIPFSLSNVSIAISESWSVIRSVKLLSLVELNICEFCFWVSVLLFSRSPSVT